MALDVLGGIFGAAGSIIGASIAADAQEEATKTQIKALEKQRRFVYDELDPSKIGGAALKADTERAQNQLALQAVVDPELLRQRYAAQAGISAQLQDIIGGESAADRVARQATEEAMGGAGVAAQAKQQLIDAALKELSLGATLPPDIQAELVQTGLQKSGKATGGAGGTGFGGQVLTTQLGSAGIALQKQRQDQAIGLLGQAQNLENSRAGILSSLFPNLQNAAAGKLGAAQNVLAQSSALAPEAGLTGSSIANIWLARVGATNQLAQQAADAAARGGYAQAQTLSAGIGGASAALAPVLSSATGSAYNWLKGIVGDDLGGGSGGQFGGGSSYG